MLPTVDVPPVAETVTQEMAREAMRQVMEPFTQFPFETPHDRANYIGALMTPALLRLLPPPWPMLCLNARQPGSGKTLLGTCIRLLHGGSHRASLPADEEEIRKQITAVLSKTSGAVVMWDNIDRNAVVSSAQISNLLTSRQWSDRPLGLTADISVPNNRLWIVTGNNIRVGGDNPRRVLWVTVDPRVDHPERRRFAFNPAKLIEDGRGPYLALVLTVVGLGPGGDAAARSHGWLVSGVPVRRHWRSRVRRRTRDVHARGHRPAPIAAERGRVGGVLPVALLPVRVGRVLDHRRGVGFVHRQIREDRARG